MKAKVAWIAVIGLALAAAGGWWWQNKRAESPPQTAVVGGVGGAGGAGGAARPGSTGPGGAAAGGAGGGGAAPGAAGARGGPAAVEVARAEVMSLTEDALALGSVKSLRGVMLRPEASGRISRLGFVQGQRVQKGQLMVQLDDTLQQAQMQQAQAQSSIARTRLQRNRELVAQGFVSQSAVDQSLADLQVADAQVALAQAQVARMKVLAPFNGTAGLRLVDEGDYVKDGADMVNIEDLSALSVQFALPERTLERLRVGQAVEFSLDALPGRNFKGRVTALDSRVDANGRSLQVLAQVDNSGALLKPGMFAKARVVFATRSGAVVVPEEALVPLGAQQVLFKLVEGEDGQKVAQRVPAKLGLRLPGKVEILSGIQAGDTVITAGHARLLRGDRVPVRVVDLNRPPGGGKPGGKGGVAVAPAPAAASSGPAAGAGAIDGARPPGTAASAARLPAPQG